MEIKFIELKPTIKIATNKNNPDLLAYVSLKLIDKHERYFTINGFTIRKSKYNNDPYLLPPSKKSGNTFFKFTLIERSLWKEIEKEIIGEYEKETIPVIN
jgi:hypothetical protein